MTTILLLTLVIAINTCCFVPGISGVTDFHSTLGHLKAQTSSDIQEQAVRNLIERFVGDAVRFFAIKVETSLRFEGKDTFKLSKTTTEQIEIIATSGVAAAWGFHYYVKNYCNAHIAWEGVRVEIPAVLPPVDVTITSNDKFRYYENVCTAGYSSAWWQWDQWEKHIDWMALNGINLALAFHAQEAIWLRVYKDMGLSLDEINQQFGGPAFLPWSRMGNIRGWGGPLTPSWHQFTIRLQHQILDRMRQLGIVPVLPAFAGHVPRAFTRIYPEANVTKIDTWNKFKEPYCCPYLLAPTDPLFKTVGGKFLRTYIDEFGTDHIYNCDTFNENEPQDSNLTSLKNLGQTVFAAMTDVDPQAIWLMQGWLFVHDFNFWTESRVEAFITSVPIGRMIVLDLQSEQFPQYTRLKSYYGQPFIWCMLHNFGGTLGMFGSAEIINKRPFEARTMNGSTMIGTGLTPEGIDQNYVIYELMNEMAYRKAPVFLDSWHVVYISILALTETENRLLKILKQQFYHYSECETEGNESSKWFEDYASRRYGVWNEYTTAAWRKMGKTVYNFHGAQRIRGHYVITRRPTLAINTWTWYDREELFQAWDNLTNARHSSRSNSKFYKHDLIDVTRQALQLKADYLYHDIVDAYKKKDAHALNNKTYLMEDLFTDLEKLLASSENFLLGKWLRSAKALATNPDEEANYEYNARNQITLWGPRGEIRDYANKQWSGVMSDYFKKRWFWFHNFLKKKLADEKAFDQSEFNRWVFEKVEQPFTQSREIYPVEPQGNSVDIAAELNVKWQNLVPRRSGISHRSRARKNQ